MQSSKYFLLILLFTVSLIFPRPEDAKRAQITAVLSQDKVISNEQVKVAFKIKIDAGWHINSNKPNEDFLIKSDISLVDTSEFILSDIVYPSAKEANLAISDKPLSVFEGEFAVFAKLKAKPSVKAGLYFAKIKFTSQACNNKTCEQEVDNMLMVQVQIAAKGESINTINADVFNKTTAPAASDDLGSNLISKNLFISLLLLFLGGLALNLTPCVYPLIPITIGFFGAQSEGRTSRLAMMGGLYLLGISLTYSIVGVVTSLSGSLFGELLQNLYVVLFIAAVFVVLSLSMFGLYEFKLPDALVNKASDSKGGMFGAFFMGLTMGIVAAPCIGPVILSVILVVAKLHDPMLGFLYFFFLSLGLGAPYFVLAIFSGKIKSLPRSGVWMDAIKHIFGVMLLGMAVYYLLPQLPKTVARYSMPVFLIIAGVYLIFFEKAGNSLKLFKYIKAGIASLIIIYGFYLMAPEPPSISWQKYSNERITEATNSSKPVIIDFYADWCIPCKELDKETFTDKSIIAESARFIALKADLTKSDNEEAKLLKDKYKITGVPTVILINSKGEEIERINEFIKAETFLAKIRQVK